MNKKFSTLLVSALLAGAATTVNAQHMLTSDNGANCAAEVQDAVKNGNVYYLTTTAFTIHTDGSRVISSYVRAKADGSAASETIAYPVRTEYILDAYYQWKAVAAGNNSDGKAIFRLQNIATGRYYSGATAGTPKAFTADELCGKYGTSTTYYSTVGDMNKPFLMAIDERDLTEEVSILNNMDKYNTSFSLQFTSPNHKDVYSFIDNAFVQGAITARLAKNAFVRFTDNATYSYSANGVLLDSGTGENTYTPATGLLLQVAGPWNGKALYSVQSKNFKGNPSGLLYVKNYVVYDEDQVKDFRASKFIVLSDDKYSQFNTDVTGTNAKGYKYTIVTGAELMGKIESVNIMADATHAAYTYSIPQTMNTLRSAWPSVSDVYTNVDEAASSVARPYENAIFNVSVRGTAAQACVNDVVLAQANAYLAGATIQGYKTYTLYKESGVTKPVFAYVFDFEGQKYVCSNKEQEGDFTHPSFVTNALVGVTVDPMKFLASKKIVNVVYYKGDDKGKTWNPKQNGENLLAKFIDNTKPEGQWIVTYNADNNTFSFKNLEGTASWTGYTLYDNGSNNYTAVAADGTEHYLTLTDAVKPNNMYGYADFTEAQLEQGFNISVITDLLGNVYLKEDHATDHKATFSQDVENASVWRMMKYTAAKDYANNIEGSDTIRVINNYTVWNPVYQRFDTKKDTVEAIAYSIYNDFTGEFLKYNPNQKAYYATKVASDKLRSDDAPKFVFKKKAINDKEGVNIIPATIQDGGNAASAWKGEKLIGSFSENKLTQDIEKYRVIDNDLFAIEPVAAPVYRTMDALSVVKIFKDSNNSDVLYEQGHFLGMEHVADVPDMKAAMLVDTAYVRYNTAKPSYLLAVGAEQVIDETICEIPGHPVHHADTVFGRFLVNMKDSMDIVNGKTPHNNPYMWETYPKLAFIEGYHTHDVLTLTGWNDKKIDLSKNADNYGVYRFRYVDREAGSFIMETKGGWIKWLNGTPVVVDKIELAEVLNLQATEEAPTANEEVAASEVSVVAVNGAIIVKGAAGKVVTVANILGQTIANQVAASDNVTIAAPAGIAVVTVDGEATKVVVK